MTANELYKILLEDKPSKAIKENEEEIFKLIPILETCKGFDQNNSEWHIYDVYEHILHVVDGVPKDLELRLAALFHDVGKPSHYQEDEKGVGHFYGHWETSQEEFEKFASEYNIQGKIRELTSNLIFYHDKSLARMTEDELKNIRKTFGKDGIRKLYTLKRADTLAQNPKHYDRLDIINNQEMNILSSFPEEIER